MKKIGKKHVFLIYATPYNQNCLVVVNGAFKDAYDFLKKIKKNPVVDEVLKHIEDNRGEYKDDAAPKNGGAWLYDKLPTGYIMMINHEDSWVDTVCNVAHETTHLVNRVLDGAGMDLCKNSEEAYTYLLADLMKKILTKIY